jgi:hypothetical protein
MIVCWVLFAITVLFAIFGWFGFVHYDSKIEIIDTEIANQESTGKGKFSDLLRKEQTAEESRNDKDSPETLREELDRWREEQVPQIEREKLVRHRSDSMAAGLLGVLLAVSILLWNIIWHVGHWIWMGRESG